MEKRLSKERNDLQRGFFTGVLTVTAEASEMAFVSAKGKKAARL